MRQYSQDDGCTSSRSAGSTRLTKPIPRWLSPRERGYATAGFVANTMYCASDTGLSRGFTHYEDFIFPEFTAPKTAVLVNRVLAVFGKILPFVEDRPSLAWLQPYVQGILAVVRLRSQGAATVNRELLDWLSRRTEPARPFFAFLNYSDAHTPYELPTGRIHRFGVAQPDERQRELIRRWGDLDKIRLASRGSTVCRRCLRRLHRGPR